MMRVLFVVNTLFLSEPLGVMLLISICKKAGHKTKLITLNHNDLCETFKEWNPDVIAYSAMTADIKTFEFHDLRLRQYLDKNGKKVFRIMGGPHPTYWPQVIYDFELDAICQGDGDRAFPALLDELQKGGSLQDIPNIALTGEGPKHKELFSDLDDLPFADRGSIYKVAPAYKACGLRSFQASRGCPYDCTYCFNHSFNKMFSGCGKIIRRRTVENLITEIEYVVKKFPPVRFIRFSDDTFVYRADDWLKEFAEKYRSRIDIVFYCLMRSNTLNEDTASLLAYAGCRSISMSIEAGDERIRNDILKRNIRDEVLIKSFEIADKYGLNVHANSMIAIPGTILNDDFNTLEFARKLLPKSPTFGICIPYQGTRIWEKAIEAGYLEREIDLNKSFGDMSPLNCYTHKEKEIQLRITYLGTIFCFVPGFLVPLMYKIIKSNLSLKICLYIGNTYQIYRDGTRVYRWAFPRNIKSLFNLMIDSIKMFGPTSKFERSINKY